jgi:hypothetical protein
MARFVGGAACRPALRGRGVRRDHGVPRRPRERGGRERPVAGGLLRAAHDTVRVGALARNRTARLHQLAARRGRHDANVPGGCRVPPVPRARGTRDRRILARGSAGSLVQREAPAPSGSPRAAPPLGVRHWHQDEGGAATLLPHALRRRKRTARAGDALRGLGYRSAEDGRRLRRRRADAIPRRGGPRRVGCRERQRGAAPRDPLSRIGLPFRIGGVAKSALDRLPRTVEWGATLELPLWLNAGPEDGSRCGIAGWRGRVPPPRPRNLRRGPPWLRHRGRARLQRRPSARRPPPPRGRRTLSRRGRRQEALDALSASLVRSGSRRFASGATATRSSSSTKTASSTTPRRTASPWSRARSPAQGSRVERRSSC